MYITKEHSRLSRNNYLRFTDSHRPSLEYLIAPWDKQLQAWAINKEANQEVKLSFQNWDKISLVNQHHLEMDDHPVNQFLRREIPFSIVQRLKVFHHLQFHLLRGIAFSRNAHDLLKSSPILLWMKLSSIINFEDWLKQWCDRELSSSHKKIMRGIFF